MNNLTRGIINLLVFGVGGATGYFVAKKKLEQQYEDKMQVEIEAIRDRWDKKIEDVQEVDPDNFAVKLKEKFEKKLDDEQAAEEDPFDGMTEEEIKQARREHRKLFARLGSNTTNYSSYFENPNQRDEVEKDEEADDDLENEEEEELGRVTEEEPYPINPEDFDNECMHYDKIEIYWYDEDDVLVDESDNIIDHDDYLTIIGPDPTVFDILDNRPALYMRNERVGADYVIFRQQCSWHRDIAGIVETPGEQEKRRAARKKNAIGGK